LVTEEQFSVVGCQFSVQSPLPGDDLEKPFCMYLQKEPADFPGRNYGVAEATPWYCEIKKRIFTTRAI
jgi:hypothetical protein